MKMPMRERLLTFAENICAITYLDCRLKWAEWSMCAHEHFKFKSFKSDLIDKTCKLFEK